MRPDDSYAYAQSVLDTHTDSRVCDLMAHTNTLKVFWILMLLCGIGCSQVASAVRLCDGALVLVDVVEGVPPAPLPFTFLLLPLLYYFFFFLFYFVFISSSSNSASSLLSSLCMRDPNVDGALVLVDVVEGVRTPCPPHTPPPTPHPPPSTLQPTPSTLHPPLSTLHPPPSTLHPPPSPSTLHPHPAPYTPHSNREAESSKVDTKSGGLNSGVAAGADADDRGAEAGVGC